MPDTTDPFRHHPELRGLVTDPAQSFFRTFDPTAFDEQARASGRPADWRYPDIIRNQLVDEARARFGGRDLWVFAYGSLMWDPGVVFAEVRHARIRGYARRFILHDEGGRGSPERPAVMAALDAVKGHDCEGLVFRIEASLLHDELELLWRREMIAPAYEPVTIPAETRQGKVEALAFVARHDTRDIRPDLTRDEQVEALAFAEGPLGTNFAYIDNLKTHFDAMGITDPEIDDLHTAAKARRLSGK